MTVISVRNLIAGLAMTLLLAGCSGSESVDQIAAVAPASAASDPASSAAAAEVAATDPGADAPALKRFTGNGFSVDLPGEPEVSTQRVRNLDVTLYVVDRKDAAVVVGVTDLPDGAPVDLDVAVSGAASNIGGAVTSSRTGIFAGHQIRDARITVTKKGQTRSGFMRIIAADGRLVQVNQFVVGKVARAPQVYRDIVASLRLS